MLPGESHEQDNDGEALFSEPQKKTAKITHGKLELKPPDFPIPEFGGGLYLRKYPIEFKPKAIGYAQSVVGGRRGPGGTVGLTSATRALGSLDKAMLASWIKNRSTHEKEVQAAAAASGTKDKKIAWKKLSVNAGRVPSNFKIEHEMVAWINNVRSDEISAGVTTSMIKQKAVELNPMFFGPIPPPHDLEESERDRNIKVAWCKRFLCSILTRCPGSFDVSIGFLDEASCAAGVLVRYFAPR